MDLVEPSGAQAPPLSGCQRGVPPSVWTVIGSSILMLVNHWPGLTVVIVVPATTLTVFLEWLWTIKVLAFFASFLLLPAQVGEAISINARAVNRIASGCFSFFITFL